MSSALLLRVSGVRRQGASSFGGAIFTGVRIDGSGQVLDAGSYLVVRASGRILAGMAVESGQWWEVTGTTHQRTLIVNGYEMHEEQIEANGASLMRPSGEHIVTLMADNPAFEGIGRVKARKLWEAFGDQLYDLLGRRDVQTLSTKLSLDIAQKAVAAWTVYGDARTLKWLHSLGFDVRLGKKLVEFFGTDTPARIEEDPYRLLSFSARWSQVDEIARSKFDVAADDVRRLQGAIEEACYRLFSEGDTLIAQPALMSALTHILGRRDPSLAKLVQDTLDRGLANGSYVVSAEGIRPVGAMAMESVVASAFARQLSFGDKAPLLEVDAIDRLIAEHERANGIAFNDEQRLAIHAASLYPLACITGGPGVGKTTVLKALYEVYDAAGVRVVQLALAGRAATRMQVATGRAASTIASFLRAFKEGSCASATVVVIDEASMVDIITMSRICELLPSHVRLLLVGDPHQLMPVGPGLVLHAIVGLPLVPRVELTVVKRFGDTIREAAAFIRDGHWPTISADAAAEFVFLPAATEEAEIASAVVDLYESDLDNTQILASHRRGPGGTESINALCQARLTSMRPALTVWNEDRSAHERTGFHLGDTVLCTRNLWHFGLQNGSLGTLVAIEDQPVWVPRGSGSDEGYALGWVDWDDGIRRPLDEEMLDDLELGYAITVHKAQGSQWPRIVVPVVPHRMLDRTLLYTAITRAQRQVLLVGDQSAAAAAVARPPRAQSRRVALGSTLADLIQAESMRNGLPEATSASRSTRQ